MSFIFCTCVHELNRMCSYQNCVNSKLNRHIQHTTEHTEIQRVTYLHAEYD